MLDTIHLPNGLRVILEKIPDVHSASVSVIVGVGSSAETPEINGISHFVEHLLFKGTQKRTAQEIAQTIEDFGGSLNAFTEKEHTNYYARILSDQVPQTIDVFCDMLLNSSFDPKEIELERQVILEEIGMYEDTPDELVYDLFFQSYWGENPLAFPVTGSIASVQNIKRDDITSFVNSYYTPDNIVFAVSGNFDENKVLDIINANFDPISQKMTICNIETPEIDYKINICIKEIEQAHLFLATNAVSILSEQRYPLAILDIILAGGISSRLFQEIREKRGLAYSISSYKALYRPAGILGIYAGTNVNSMQEVIKIIIDQLEDIKCNGLTEEELLRGKKQLKGSLLLGLESMYHRAYRNGHSENYYNTILSIEEICKNIQSVELNDIKNLAGELFKKEYYALSVVSSKNLDNETCSYFLE